MLGGWGQSPCYHAAQHQNTKHMTPHAFITKWGSRGTACHLNEKQGAQSHFLDPCELLDVSKPGSEPGYLFEEGTRVLGAAVAACGWAGYTPQMSDDDIPARLLALDLLRVSSP